ncbi:MAG: phosphatase PAP2 family protein [Bacillota bacterium]
MGLQVIQWLQHFSTPTLDSIFRALSDLGSEAFYLAAIPIIFWCLDKKLGIRLAYIFLFSAWVNAGLKDLFATSRPPWTVVRNLYPESAAGYAFPSGHAQGSSVFWSYLAIQSRSRLLSVLAGVVIFLVGLSRVYLGVHWPADVLGGTALGLALSFLFSWIGGLFQGWRAAFPMRLIAGVIIPLGMLAVYRGPDGPKIVGFLLGMAVGWAFEERFVSFRTGAGFLAQVAKVAIGLAALAGLREGLKLVLGGGMVLDLVRYSVLGLWGSFVWPAIFTRVGLLGGGRR